MAKSIYIWNLGIINTYQGLDKLVESPETYSCQQVVHLNEEFDDKNQKLLLTSLRNAKREMKELEQQNKRLQQHLEQ